MGGGVNCRGGGGTVPASRALAHACALPRVRSRAWCILRATSFHSPSRSTPLWLPPFCMPVTSCTISRRGDAARASPCEGAWRRGALRSGHILGPQLRLAAHTRRSAGRSALIECAMSMHRHMPHAKHNCPARHIDRIDRRRPAIGHASTAAATAAAPVVPAATPAAAAAACDRAESGVKVDDVHQAAQLEPSAAVGQPTAVDERRGADAALTRRREAGTRRALEQGRRVGVRGGRAGRTTARHSSAMRRGGPAWVVARAHLPIRVLAPAQRRVAAAVAPRGDGRAVVRREDEERARPHALRTAPQSKGEVARGVARLRHTAQRDASRGGL
eukprot:7375990-Prymnesium_polylepis.2